VPSSCREGLHGKPLVGGKQQHTNDKLNVGEILEDLATRVEGIHKQLERCDSQLGMIMPGEVQHQERKLVRSASGSCLSGRGSGSSHRIASSRVAVALEPGKGLGLLDEGHLCVKPIQVMAQVHSFLVLVYLDRDRTMARYRPDTVGSNSPTHPGGCTCIFEHVEHVGDDVVNVQVKAAAEGFAQQGLSFVHNLVAFGGVLNMLRAGHVASVQEQEQVARQRMALPFIGIEPKAKCSNPKKWGGG
jgi:hypothetical protein